MRTANLKILSVVLLISTFLGSCSSKLPSPGKQLCENIVGTWEWAGEETHTDAISKIFVINTWEISTTGDQKTDFEIKRVLTKKQSATMSTVEKIFSFVSEKGSVVGGAAAETLDMQNSQDNHCLSGSKIQSGYKLPHDWYLINLLGSGSEHLTLYSVKFQDKGNKMIWTVASNSHSFSTIALDALGSHQLEHRDWLKDWWKPLAYTASPKTIILKRVK